MTCGVWWPMSVNPSAGDSETGRYLDLPDQSLPGQYSELAPGSARGPVSKNKVESNR